MVATVQGAESYHEYMKGLEFHYRLPDPGPYLTHSFDLSLLDLARLDSLSKELLAITDYQSIMFFGTSVSDVFNHLDQSQVIDVISHYNIMDIFFVSLLRQF